MFFFSSYFKEFYHCHKLSCLNTMCCGEESMETVIIKLAFFFTRPRPSGAPWYTERINFGGRTSFTYKLCNVEQAMKSSFNLSFLLWWMGTAGVFYRLPVIVGSLPCAATSHGLCLHSPPCNTDHFLHLQQGSRWT